MNVKKVGNVFRYYALQLERTLRYQCLSYQELTIGLEEFSLVTYLAAMINEFGDICTSKVNEININKIYFE